MNKDRKSRPKILLVNRAIIINSNSQLLIIKRSSSDPYMPGKWEIPGGKLDAGQDVSNALEREVLEETGLVVTPTDKLVYWHSEILTTGKYKGLPYIVLVGYAKPIGGNIKLSDEHTEYAWVTKNTMFDYDLTHESRAALCVLLEKL